MFVRVPTEMRDRSLYIVGKTRSGKSTLLLNLMHQDIRAGHGVGLIDPHGDLAQDLLARVPENRASDTIYVDAADTDHHVPIDLFRTQTDREVGILAADLLVAFRRLSDSWGERMEAILRYAFHTLLRAGSATLLDVPKLLRNECYRRQILSRVTESALIEFWEEQFPKLPRDAIQPILSRMSEFELSRPLAALLGSAGEGVDFTDVIQNKKIFIANLGGLGEDEKKLLGSLLVSQIQLAIMRRAEIPIHERVPFFLYVDEFQNFTTSAFEKILSEAGKFRLSLTLAHQFVSQLDDRLRKAIIGNVGTTILFSLGRDDAQYFRSELGSFTAEDVTNLDVRAHEAICRPLRSGDTFKFVTLPPPPLPERSFADEIITRTRERYRPATSVHDDGPNQNERPAARGETRHGVNGGATACALPPASATQKSKILHYLSLAAYLTTPQVLLLVYAHLPEQARSAAAARDLKKLVADGKIHKCADRFGRHHIYAISPAVRPTAHNLGVRDIFVKIVRSDMRISEVVFSPRFPGLTPDMAVTFVLPDGSTVATLWEYDTGTEGLAEIEDKMGRYEAYRSSHRVTFVAGTPERLAQLLKIRRDSFIQFTDAASLQTLQDPVFQRRDANGESFFNVETHTGGCPQ